MSDNSENLQNIYLLYHLSESGANFSFHNIFIYFYSLPTKDSISVILIVLVEAINKLEVINILEMIFRFLCIFKRSLEANLHLLKKRIFFFREIIFAGVFGKDVAVFSPAR